AASEEDTEDAWLGEFASDFRTRFLTLLSFPKFRDFSSVLGLSILEAVNQCPAIKRLDASPSSSSNTKTLTPALLNTLLTPFDLKRLESYGNNQLDYHVILDLMPVISRLFFARKLASSSEEPDKDEKSSRVTLSAVQSAILLAMGLQLKSVEDVEAELNLPVNQVLALLVKVVRKISKRLSDIVRSDLEKELPAPPSAAHESRVVLGSGKQTQALEEELEEAAEEDREEKEKRERQREIIGALDLRKYAIYTSGTDWTAAEAAVASGKGKGVISVKSNSMVNKKRNAEADEGGQANVIGDEGKGTRMGGKNVKLQPSI
ncbi:hypothetical protein MPER_07614, partial [Moniliophthora perniciosa FA553]